MPTFLDGDIVVLARGSEPFIVIDDSIVDNRSKIEYAFIVDKAAYEAGEEMTGVNSGYERVCLLRKENE